VMTIRKNFKNPYPAVDIIIELKEGIILIERRNPPFGWALPGGFIEYGETAEEAAIREAKEETGLDIELQTLLGVYSAPDRDPRFHTISIAYIAKSSGIPQGGDDAKKASIFTIESLPEPVVFDHKKIIQDYIIFKQTGKKPPPLVK